MSDRPEVLLSHADYIEDIKIRWQIHQYEIAKLKEDVANMFNFITDSFYYRCTDV